MRRPSVHWFTGSYAASHNPAVYYRALTAAASTPSTSARSHATSIRTPCAPTRPSRRTCVTACTTARQPAATPGCAACWGASRRARRTSAARWRSFVTFDESDDHSGDRNVPTFVVSPSTAPGTRAAARFNHYSLLRTTEDMLGIQPYLGERAEHRACGRHSICERLRLLHDLHQLRLLTRARFDGQQIADARRVELVLERVGLER